MNAASEILSADARGGDLQTSYTTSAPLVGYSRLSRVAPTSDTALHTHQVRSLGEPRRSRDLDDTHTITEIRNRPDSFVRTPDTMSALPDSARVGGAASRRNISRAALA